MTEQHDELAQMVTALVECATGREQAELFARTRGHAPVARARQVAMYLSHVVLSMSLAQVGGAFGRDKSTVAHAVHQIEDLRDEPVFDDWMNGLEESLRMLFETRKTSPHVLSGVWRGVARVGGKSAGQSAPAPAIP